MALMRPLEAKFGQSWVDRRSETDSGRNIPEMDISAFAQDQEQKSIGVLEELGTLKVGTFLS